MTRPGIEPKTLHAGGEHSTTRSPFAARYEYEINWCKTILTSARCFCRTHVAEISSMETLGSSDRLVFPSSPKQLRLSRSLEANSITSLTTLLISSLEENELPRLGFTDTNRYAQLRIRILQHLVRSSTERKPEIEYSQLHFFF